MMLQVLWQHRLMVLSVGTLLETIRLPVDTVVVRVQPTHLTSTAASMLEAEVVVALYPLIQEEGAVSIQQ